MLEEVKLVFATPETLKQPKGGLIIEEPQEQDHILGASGPDFEVLSVDSKWSKYCPIPELQRSKYGDSYMCVSFSNNNTHEFLINRLYGESANFSDLFLGVGSGTKPNCGNSKRAVADWKRLNGFVAESDYPFSQDMTVEQMYKPLSKELLQKGKNNLAQYSFWYKWLGANDARSLINGLKYSPLQVDVSGQYAMNEKGYVVWMPGSSYAHEVVLFDFEPNECWYIFDSEAMQLIKFAWDYPFGSPMIHAVKKSMNIEILKKKGQSGLAVKTFGEPSLIFFSGGSVTGETLFKSIYGVTNFKQIPIKEVDEWPYPPKHILNCSKYE